MLLIDTRERLSKIEHITKYLDKHGIEYDRTKLYFGDYCFFDNPMLVIDRKKNLNELAANVTMDIDRFKAELERAQKSGARLIILVEQNTFRVKTAGSTRTIRIQTIDDIYLWKHTHMNIYGDRVARILRSLMQRYPVEIMFCNRQQTAQKIIEVLENGY